MALSVHAQTPAPASAAAQDRSQDPAYSVFRWIKIQGDAPRKGDTAKLKPKAEPAAPPVRRPEAQAARAPVERTEPQASSAAPATSGLGEPASQTQAQTVVAAPVAPPPAAVTVAAAAPAAAAPAPEPVHEVEAELKLISQAQPVIPRDLRSSGFSGKVVVSFTVQPDGTVADPSVVSASNRKMGKPATEAVAKWRFEPIRTARTVQVEIEFNL